MTVQSSESGIERGSNVEQVGGLQTIIKSMNLIDSINCNNLI